jgi:hypothetical protein
MTILFLFIPDDFVWTDVTANNNDRLITSFSCRTVRIGSYKFESKEKVKENNLIMFCSHEVSHDDDFLQVVISARGIQIIAPTVNTKEPVKFNIMHSEVVKIVAHFSKQLQIFFVYTKPSCARYITKELNMEQSGDNGKSREDETIAMLIKISFQLFSSHPYRASNHRKRSFS